MEERELKNIDRLCATFCYRKTCLNVGRLFMAPCENFSHSDSKVSLTQRDLNQEVSINCGSLVN